MKIKMTRGDLFQIASDVTALAPDKPGNAEHYRRFGDAVHKLQKSIIPDFDAEKKAAKDSLPESERSEAAFRKIDKAAAEVPVHLSVDPKDLRAFTLACVAFWKSPMVDRNGAVLPNGQPLNNLQRLHEDLSVLGVWAAWTLGDRLAVDDPQDEVEFPLARLVDEEAQEEEFPIGALTEE